MLAKAIFWGASPALDRQRVSAGEHNHTCEIIALSRSGCSPPYLPDLCRGSIARSDGSWRLSDAARTQTAFWMHREAWPVVSRNFTVRHELCALASRPARTGASTLPDSSRCSNLTVCRWRRMKRSSPARASMTKIAAARIDAEQIHRRKQECQDRAATRRGAKSWLRTKASAAETLPLECESSDACVTRRRSTSATFTRFDMRGLTGPAG